MRAHHRHLLRTVLTALAGVAAWYWLVPPPYPGLHAQPSSWWQGLAWAELAAVLGVWFGVRLTVFFAGPAWHAALVTDRVRASYRYKQKHERGKGRRAVPAWLVRATYWADRYRCIYCGRGRADGLVLNWDHIKPHDRGGLVSPWNGGTLCQHDNITKSDVWVYPDGRAYYNPFTGHGFTEEHLGLALDILRAEQRRRKHPVRLARLVFACLVF
jgi:5-methylcytosine-specific restriction endonuclease McrA